jgi:hypothetical protein
MNRLIGFGTLLAALALLPACGSSSTTSPSTSTTPETDTFSSAIAIGGSTSRTFTMSSAGAVQVTLTSYGAGQPGGLGIGVPVSTVGGPCALTQSVIATPGGSPQIVTTADAGSYCVQIYDIGNLTGDTGFTITIQHP